MLQTTDATIARVIKHPDGIDEREDNMIKNATALKAQQPSCSATVVFSGSGSKKFVLGTLRVVTVKALALAQELRRELPEKGFQMQCAMCQLADYGKGTSMGENSSHGCERTSGHLCERGGTP